MIEQFNINNIKLLQAMGATVYVGTNFSQPGTITAQVCKHLQQKLDELGVTYYQVDFMRRLGNHQANRRALNQVCQIIEENGINGIHTHSPLGSIIARRAGRRMHVKVLYTTHGLQFFKGGPLKDWLLFFPVEWYYAHWTTGIVTVNQTDYAISRFLPVKHRYYIPGVGVDISRIAQIPLDQQRQLRAATRRRLGVSDDDCLIISVGELSNRKNHATVIRAIKKLNNPHLKYVIAGIGKEQDHLQELIQQLGLAQQVSLLGYIDNLDGLYFAADLNVMASTREGLGLAGIEGLAHGTYMVGSQRTGMRDYITNDRLGLLVRDPLNVAELANTIERAVSLRKRTSQDYMVQSIKRFDIAHIDQLMKDIYRQTFFN